MGCDAIVGMKGEDAIPDKVGPRLQLIALADW